MKVGLPSIVLCVALSASVFGQITIFTPSNVVECEPSLITWTGGTAPYFLTVLPGNQPSGQILQNLGEIDGTSVSWVVPFPGGTSLGLTIKDSTGLPASSGMFTVTSSSNSACVGMTALNTGGSGGTSAPTTTTAPGPVSIPTTPVPTSAATSASSSAPSTSPSHTSAAATRQPPIGVAAIIAMMMISISV